MYLMLFEKYNLIDQLLLASVYMFIREGHNKTFICQKMKFENYKFYQLFLVSFYMMIKHDHDNTFI